MYIPSLSVLLATFFSTAHSIPLAQQQGSQNGTSTEPSQTQSSPTTTPTRPSSTPTCSSKEHVVILAANSPHPTEVMSRVGLDPNHQDLKYTYNNSAFSGFSATIHSSSVHALSAMDDVAHVEETIQITSHSSAPPQPNAKTRSSSTWGLQRISSQSTVSGNPSSLSYTYAYTSPALGTGVDIYVVDTGLYTANLAFTGRARTGFSYTPDTSDGDGHGTHVAGTAAGTSFGVASNANLVGVKVLGADGSGTSSDTVAGLDYVVQAHDARRGQPGFVGSLINMSWGLGDTSASINAAITAAVAQGIHVAVAAGNDAKDACAATPAQLGGPRSDAVVTVGSVGEDNAISKFSNTGTCVDVYAPGEDVVSAWKDSPNEVNTLSGTSMATPHVTGVMAYLMAGDAGLAADPKALKSRLVGMALQGVVGGNSVNGGAKVLLNNGVTDPTGLEGII